MRRGLFEGIHPKIATSLFSLGICYLSLGALKDSSNYLMASSKMRKKLYKNDHFEMADSLYHLGVISETLGCNDYQEYYTQSYEIRIRLLRKLYKDSNDQDLASIYLDNNLDELRKSITNYKTQPDVADTDSDINSPGDASQYLNMNPDDVQKWMIAVKINTLIQKSIKATNADGHTLYQLFLMSQEIPESFSRILRTATNYSIESSDINHFQECLSRIFKK